MGAGLSTPNKRMVKMKTIYLNMKTSYGIETVDEFSPEPGQRLRDFYRYVREMVSEYRMSGMNVYQSSRCTAEWRRK
jgi:hypothetical protein